MGGTCPNTVGPYPRTVRNRRGRDRTRPGPNHTCPNPVGPTTGPTHDASEPGRAHQFGFTLFYGVLRIFYGVRLVRPDTHLTVSEHGRARPHRVRTRPDPPPPIYAFLRGFTDILRGQACSAGHPPDRVRPLPGPNMTCPNPAGSEHDVSEPGRAYHPRFTLFYGVLRIFYGVRQVRPDTHMTVADHCQIRS